MPGTFSAIWGLAGIIFLLASAIYRMTLPSVEAFKYNFLWYHWASLVINVVFMVLVKGYLGFHKGFSPRVAARAKHLKEHPVLPGPIFGPINWATTLLAPLFCMGYLNSPGKRKIASFSITAAIVAMIILIRKLPQPWRGIIDFGVITGLSCGILSLVIWGYHALFTKDFDYPNEVIR